MVFNYEIFFWFQIKHCLTFGNKNFVFIFVQPAVCYPKRLPSRYTRFRCFLFRKTIIYTRLDCNLKSMETLYWTSSTAIVFVVIRLFFQSDAKNVAFDYRYKLYEIWYWKSEKEKRKIWTEFMGHKISKKKKNRKEMTSRNCNENMTIKVIKFLILFL